MTQESVALETGLSRNMVMGIEGGRRSVAYERLFDLAAALGVSINELMEPAVTQPERSPSSDQP